ncbi:MAG: hypothetical protein M1822_008890 [Bathelium mastoideum]|nr:MAG: hypothetical protein M1822_008890 [Bathelium mastoideum]
MEEFSDDEEDPWTPTTDDEWVDPLVARFGDEPLVRAARDAEQVRQLLSNGTSVTAEGLFAAIEALSLDAVKAILEVTNPNIRSKKATITSTGTYEDYVDRDFAPLFSKDWHDSTALQLAAHAPLGRKSDLSTTRALIMSVLLDHGTHIYAITSQPIRRPEVYPFPGEGSIDLSSPSLEYPYPQADGPDQPLVLPYTHRTVVHSILEDGGYAAPILNQKSQPLDLEAHDPLGRTLIHAACRSGIGADASLTATIEDCHWDTEIGGMMRDPFTSPSSSLFHTLRLRGADMYAVDAQGKNILHHLFEAHDGNYISWRPPVIKNTLSYVLSNYQELVNQPDKLGTYPLHSALQRRLRYPLKNRFTDMAELDTEIDILLSSGANPCVLDARGNSCLHYLASEGLFETLRGDQTRSLFKIFLEKGVDVDARNEAGRTVVEIMLDDDGERSQRRTSEYLSELRSARNPDDVEKEVFDLLNRAGVKLTERDAKGRGLLHFVARSATKRATARAEMLVQRGVDVRGRDEEGETPVDVAREVGNEDVLRVLENFLTNN